MKWIKYHFSYLKDKKWMLILTLIFVALWIVFFYLGGGFESKVERILNLKTYIYEYEEETFRLLNILIAFFIINLSKDIFILDEPHIFIINKKKYLITKIITYLLYYFILIFIFYTVYQVIYIVLYGFNPFNYRYLTSLLINSAIIHGLTILLLGQGKAILKMILMLIMYLLLDRLLLLNYPFIEIINFYYPLTNLSYPMLGYKHIFLYVITVYILAFYKHYESFS